MSVWDEQFRGPCWEIVKAARHSAWERRLQQAAEEHEQMLREDRAAAAAWAAEVLADPSMVVLDTETTGLLDGPDPAHLVEIAVMAGEGTILLDSLVHPQMPIPPAATAIHGITDAMVSDAPTFSEILPRLTAVLTGRRVLIYNAAFNRSILRREIERHHRSATTDAVLRRPDAPSPADHWISALRTECAMEQYAQWFGQWHDYHQSYTWQPLNGGRGIVKSCGWRGLG